MRWYLSCLTAESFTEASVHSIYPCWLGKYFYLLFLFSFYFLFPWGFGELWAGRGILVVGTVGRVIQHSPKLPQPKHIRAAPYGQHHLCVSRRKKGLGECGKSTLGPVLAQPWYFIAWHGSQDWRFQLERTSASPEWQVLVVPGNWAAEQGAVWDWVQSGTSVSMAPS